MKFANFIPVLMASAAFFSAQANAATTIASSDFNAGTDGWTTGEFTNSAPGTLTPTFEPSNGVILTTDTAANVAFIAPSAYLGNLSAAFGGTLSFELSNTANDNPALYSAIAITSGSTTIFSQRVLGPGVTLTPYSVVFTGANFINSNPFSAGGTALTDAQLQGILNNVTKFAILADWHSGADNTRLDNVLLTSGAPAVPEPGTWAMFILGLGLVGAAMRSRKSGITALSDG